MAAEHSDELHREIEDLFNWNPPHLIPGEAMKRTKASTATRNPSFYHQHLSDDLVLKRVVRFPSLVNQLATNVDNALAAASNTLPQALGYFITANQRNIDRRRLGRTVRDENDVANFYDKTTGTYCAYVASTLALHPTASFSEWDGLLRWTQSLPSSTYAIVDGMLCFEPEDDGVENAEQLAAIEKTIESKSLSVFEKMRESARPLATWEVLSVGSVQVMAEVPNLGKFSWTTCNDCGAKHQLTTKKQNKVTPRGPDALAPPWDLPDDPLHSDEEIDVQLLTSHATLQQPVTARRSLRSSTRPPPPPSAPGGGPSAMDKCKKRKRDEEEGDRAYLDRHGLIAQSLVKKAWVRAVLADGTVIVLHSGNHELVCIRHRATQTLYVSDLIEPPVCANPGYGKVHIGIYIAAIQETIDRQLQPKLKPPGDGGSDLIGGDHDRDRNQGSGSGSKDGGGYRGGRSRGGRWVRKSDRLQTSAGRKGRTDDKPVAIEKAIHVANKRDVVFLYLQYGIYDSPVPASFVRSAPSIMARTRCPTPSPPFPPRAMRTCRPEECLTIVLTSEIGRGATGVVHRGTLKLDLKSVTMTLDVVVKLAFDTEQRDALKSEYEIYRHLRSKGVCRGIATTLGIFDDSEGAACALVMLYAGVPLCEESQGNLSISDRESVLSTLKSIHRAGVLHGDIREENILIGDSGVTIVDFAYSKQCDNQRHKNQEFALLRNILGLAGNGH
ncbi:hypothetical protein APHAL10511_000304 [Amanita phalloides]|nr:hypothetical protein APHAL10511_000304 [Amanita phalloides]